MNVLSLRINAVKSDESSKKNVVDLLKIEITEDFWSVELQEQMKAINDHTITELQLRELRKFAQKVTEANQDREKITRKLVQIYFKEQVKHPAKSTIQSCFNQSSEQELIVNTFKSEITKLATSLDTSSNECHHFVGCLNEACQNFRPAMVAISQEAEVIVKFAKRLIWKYDENLRNELSPAQKNEVSQKLHNTLQMVIFCVKSYLQETVKSSEQGFRETLTEIEGKCVELLDNSDLPMDIKNNCSMLIVIQAKLTGVETYMEWIKDDDTNYVKRLSLISGVINSITPSNIDFKFLAEVSKILKAVFITSSVDPSAMLAVARSLMHITKKISGLCNLKNTSELSEISRSAMSVAFLNLEHHMDSVRHLSRDILKNLTDICVKIENGQELLSEIFYNIEKLESTNLKSIVVLSISPALPTSKVLENLKDFQCNLLSSLSDNKVTNHNIINCYEALAQKSLEETTFDVWYGTFMQPAIESMKDKYQHPSEERTIIEDLLMRFVKKEKNVLERILKNREEFDIGFTLLCLSTGKKTGRYENIQSTDELWKGLISFDEIKNAMIHGDDNVRVSALKVIVESRRATELFTSQELEVLIYFLKYNVNVQTPSTRQNILGLVKNVFVRIQAILQAAIRKKDLETVEYYFGFLLKLQEFCLESLFDGANFSRRTLSLRLLFYIFEAVNEHLKERSSEFWTQKKFDVLMNVLNDSFEANKGMAIEIMKFIAHSDIRKFNKLSLERLNSMANSIKPPESLTASYLIEFMAKFIVEVDESQTLPSASTFKTLLWCEKFLLESLEVAEKSLIVASSKNPMYGFVLGIRHLLSKIDLKPLAEHQQWKDFFARLIRICKRLSEVVAPVVNNSAPEGILPEENVQDDWIEIVEQTTPQIILLCSWRTIKEVSLLLGDICLRAALEVDQFLTIGDHFLELLSKTKHRGAFEQCFFGFSQLCLRLWTCHEPELHKLPSEMLNQMIESISGVDRDANELLSMKNLCSTRRSAGLPFMIQALITSELKVSTNKNFHFVMKNLISFCRTGEFLESRTHSLNILRALFRCSDLNDAIGEYISDGIKCAILGYGAESWIERNSSTLLFSALMVRIFGVQRTKDSNDLNIRNKMTGRIFFLRYPELYDFFMEQLKEAAEHVMAVKMNAKLHPLLLLLIRLYPSALEGSESNLTLTRFIPVVTICSGCVEIQTRILCAEFIANVLPPDQLIPRIMKHIEILQNTENIPANVAHGILLQILHSMKTIPDGERSLHTILQAFIKSGFALMFKSKLILFATYLDILLEICEKIWSEIQCVNKCVSNHVEELLGIEISGYYGITMIAEKLFLLQQMTISFGIPVKKMIFENIKMRPFLTHQILNGLLMSASLEYTAEMQDDYEISDRELFIIKSMSEERRAGLCRNPLSILAPVVKQENHENENSNLKFQLLTLLKQGDYLQMIKIFDILSFLDYSPGESTKEELATMIQKSLKKPEHLKKSLLKYASRVVQHENFVASTDFEFLVEISTDASLHVKRVASEFVETLASWFYFNDESPKLSKNLMYFAKSLILLLMDDECEIRERNAAVVMKLVGQENRKVTPTYAQEVFIDFLVNKSPNLNENQAIAMVILIIADNKGGENSLDDNINEYRVFDKNEVNIFSETFIVRKQCLEAVNGKLSKIDKDETDDKIENIKEASRIFGISNSDEIIEKTLQSCLI